MKKLILLIFNILLFSSTCLIAQSVEMADDFYSPDKVRELRIKFEQQNWEYLMDSIRTQGDGLLLGDASIDGNKFENVGIRYRGSKSFSTGSKRNAFHIKLNYINKNQNHKGYKTIKLSNALRDPSMVREVLSYEIARKYMPAPKAGYVKLFINNKLIGLFVNIQAIDDNFLAQSFGSSSNTHVKCGMHVKQSPANCLKKISGSLQYEKNAQCYTANFEMKSKEGWDDLIELTKVLNEDSENIESVLNVDRALWMLAFNNVLVNLNSYSGQNSENYIIYKDNYGQFNPIIWDLNLSFGSYKNTGVGSDLTLEKLQKLDPLLHADNPSKPLIHQLLKNPLYKKIYLSHLRTILYDNFVNGEYEARAKSLQSIIRSSFNNDPNKFYKSQDFDSSLTKTIGRRSKIPGIVELMSKRARFLKKHPDVSIFPPEVEDIEIMRRQKFETANIKTFQIRAKVKKRAKRVKLYYRSNTNEMFTSVYMADDGNNNDGAAGDKVFGVTIDPKGAFDSIEYYILAENAKAAGFYPSDYMYSPHTSTISELNN